MIRPILNDVKMIRQKSYFVWMVEFANERHYSSWLVVIIWFITYTTSEVAFSNCDMDMVCSELVLYKLQWFQQKINCSSLQKSS